jgi:hypothetical protein
VPAEVHHRLAHPVARQLGLRPVRVEDAHVRDDALLAALSDQENAVRADPGVRRAQDAHAGSGQLERQLPFFDDQIVVAQRLPLLEAHGAGL